MEKKRMGQVDGLVYELKTSNRKTLSIVIEGDGHLVVHAPRRISLDRIEGFLREKRVWILKKQEECLVKLARYPVCHMEPGDVVPYLGERWMLQFGSFRRIGVVRNENLPEDVPKAAGASGYLLLPAHTGMEQLITWFRKQARSYFTLRVDYFSDQMQVHYQSIRISSAHTNWGSCSGDCRLNFSWYLILCPPRVIDYVVVHELCHTVHHDHSKAFWGLVAETIPEYAGLRKWLKDNSRIMNVFEDSAAASQPCQE